MELTMKTQVRFATNYFFDTGVYFPKFSIIAFYYSIVPVTHPRTRITLHVIAAITVASALVTFFGDTFWCGSNLAVNWWVSAQIPISVIRISGHL